MTPSKTYLSDHPISGRSEDRFNRGPFAERVAETIGARADPTSLVIGIYGPWGDGKTSVLRMMAEALRSSDRSVVISFNPWLYESQAELIKGFFSTLADGVGQKLSTKLEEIGRFLRDYGSLLSAASLGGLKDVGSALSAPSLDELRSRIEKVLCDSEHRVVVLIDDIDRLDRREIQAIFKLVKLTGGFENVCYVLAFDDQVVAEALGEQYGSGGAQAGRSFLEKIVQVPLHLPPVDEISLRELVFEVVNASIALSEVDFAQEDADSFVRHFVDGLEIRIKTPRQAKRYGNALAFALPILKGEVNVHDQMLLEGIRLLFSRLYDAIRANPDIFLGKDVSGPDEWSKRWKERSREVVESALSDNTPDEQEAARALLRVLFPRLHAVSGNTGYGSDSEANWAKNQRLCSSSYFYRYFSYAIPSGDISDQAITALIREAEEGVPSSLDEKVHLLFEKSGTARVAIKKLRAREKLITAPGAKVLALAIARSGRLLPNEKGIFSSVLSTASQAGILLCNLIKRVPSIEARDKFAAELLDVAEPIPFAIACFWWVRSDKEQSETSTVTAAAELAIGRALAVRITETAKETPPYSKWPDYASSVMWVWKTYGEDGEVKQYVDSRIASDPHEAVRYLLAFLPTAFSLETGLPHKGGLRSEGYNTVTEFASPDSILQALKSLYGDSLDSAEYYQSEDVSIEQRVARQFAFLYKKDSQDAARPAVELAATGETPALD